MGRLDEIENIINARMDEINRRIGSGAGTSFGGTSPAIHMPTSPTPPDAAMLIRSVVAMPAVPTQCPPQLFETSGNELLQLMQYVCASPHVTGNVKYAALVDQLTFSVDMDDSEINAYATVRDGKTPTIMFKGGAVRFANLVSAAYVGSVAVRERQPSNPLPEITASLGRFMIDNNAHLAQDVVCRFAERYNLHLVMTDPTLGRKARSFAAGLTIGILAHEFGHLALGHCYGGRANLEVSRNQEREADSFASSVISSSPFGDYLVFGSVLWEAVWVWVEKATGHVATTHPLASERLAALIRANPSVAAEFGLSA